MSGANDFVAIAKFAKTKRDWLEKYLDLPEDTPSHDTFGRVFAAGGWPGVCPRIGPKDHQAVRSSAG